MVAIQLCIANNLELKTIELRPFSKTNKIVILGKGNTCLKLTSHGILHYCVQPVY